MVGPPPRPPPVQAFRIYFTKSVCMFFVIIYYSIYLTNNEVDVVLDEDGHGPP